RVSYASPALIIEGVQFEMENTITVNNATTNAEQTFFIWETPHITQSLLRGIVIDNDFYLASFRMAKERLDAHNVPDRSGFHMIAAIQKAESVGIYFIQLPMYRGEAREYREKNGTVAW
ncbi:MAG: hypothetical protein ACMUFK_05160, partial [Thermoplasmatota archaeon]